jgi:peptidyl-prolyl cis-trans isomerase A (cyclophilin A)
MKKIINPSAILYIILLIAIVLIIGLASGNSSTKLGINNNIKIMKENTSTAVLETNLGNIEIALLADKAPKTVENFLKLSKSGFYDNTKFHRVIKGFMIQGGDPYSKGEDKSVYGTGGPGYAFADEINDAPMVRGMVAMANSGPNTNGSQFFIITASSTPWLNGHHTVFGQVISGMDTVDKIENSKTDARDLPVTPVIVEKVTVK